MTLTRTATLFGSRPGIGKAAKRRPDWNDQKYSEIWRARRIGQTPQNFGKKLKRNTVSLDEMNQIADVLDVKFEQSFIFPNGECIKTSNE